MSLIPIILADLEQARRYASDMVSHIEEDWWFRQPAEGINHLAWQVGHMAIAQYGLCLKRVRGVFPEDDELCPIADYARLFGKGSVPTSKPGDYPTPNEICSVFAAIHKKVREETAILDPVVLDESAGPPHPMFATKGEALRFAPKHEMLHVGQIGLLRRLLGGEILR